jgi:hypothetical protein
MNFLVNPPLPLCNTYFPVARYAVLSPLKFMLLLSFDLILRLLPAFLLGRNSFSCDLFIPAEILAL